MASSSENCADDHSDDKQKSSSSQSHRYPSDDAKVEQTKITNNSIDHHSEQVREGYEDNNDINQRNEESYLEETRKRASRIDELNKIHIMDEKTANEIVDLV
jgi:hypothetical protein